MSELEESFTPQPEPGANGIPPRPPKKTAQGLEDDLPSRGSILDEIERRLARYTEARIYRDSFSITCLPSHPDGFMVMLRVNRNKQGELYSVFYNGSRVDFTHRKSAVIEFGFGLSNGCRLKEYSRKGKAYRWIVELWDVNERRWRPDWDFMPWSDTLWQFWQPTSFRYLQNRLIDLDGDEARAAA